MSEEPRAGDYYIVPARTLRGSPDQMVADIDEAIQALMGLRQLIGLRRVGVADTSRVEEHSSDSNRAPRKAGGKSP